MNKSIDRIVNILAGAALAIGVMKGPDIYSALTAPEPLLRGIVIDSYVWETTFGFGTRRGRDIIEYKIKTENGEEVFAANRGVRLAQNGEHIEFRLGGSVGSEPHESYETKADGTRVPIQIYP